MSAKEKEPLYGVLSEIEKYPKKSTIAKAHNYTIDWNEQRIIWSLDGQEVRTLEQSRLRCLIIILTSLC